MESKSPEFNSLVNRYHLVSIENDSLKIGAVHAEKMAITLEGRYDAEASILLEMKTFMNTILSDLKTETDPAQIFKKTMTHLDEAERKTFMIHNLLEGVKSGKSLSDMTRSFQYLGLMDSPPADANQNQDSPYFIPPPPPEAPMPKQAAPEAKGIGAWLMKTFKSVRKLIGHLLGMAENALKSIPKFVGVKPVIGFGGLPFPMPTISFILETGSITLHDMLEWIFEDDYTKAVQTT